MTTTPPIAEKPFPWPPPAVTSLPDLPCEDCGKRLPPDDLIERRPDDVSVELLCPECDKTRPAREAEEAQAKKQAIELFSRFRDLFGQIQAGRIDGATSTDLNIAFMEKFGGVNGFVEFWYHQIQRDITDERPGSRYRVLQQCQSIAKIIHTSNEFQAKMQDVRHVSDEALAAELEQMIREGVGLKMRELARRLTVDEFVQLKQAIVENEGIPSA